MTKNFVSSFFIFFVLLGNIRAEGDPATGAEPGGIGKTVFDLFSSGRFDEARDAVRKEPIFADAKYESSRDDLQSMLGAANCFTHFGDLAEAERIYRSTADSALKHPESGPAMAAMIYSQLAELFDKQQKTDAAEHVYVEALKLAAKDAQRNPVPLGIILSGLGEHYAQNEYFAKADQNFVQALNILMQTSHSSVVKTCKDLAFSLERQGKYEPAAQLYTAALEILQRSKVTDSPEYPWVFYGLARVMRIQGRFEEAEKLYLSALEEYEKKLDEKKVVRSPLFSLYELYRDMASLGKLEGLCKNLHEICKEKLGEDHDETLECLRILALGYEKAGRKDEAVAVLRDLLKHCGKDDGKNENSRSLKRSMVQHSLARILVALKHYDEAEKLFEESFHHGDNRLLAMSSRSLELGKLYRQKGDKDKSLDFLEKSIEYAMEDLNQSFRIGHAWSGYDDGFETMLEFRYEQADTGKIHETMEQFRLYRFFASHRARLGNLLENVEKNKADSLREKFCGFRNEYSRRHIQRHVLRERLKKTDNGEEKPDPEMTGPELEKRIEAVEKQREEAKKGFDETLEEILAVSPAYRQMLSEDGKPIALDRLHATLEKERTVMLEYFVGRENVFLIALGSGLTPKAYSLEITEEQAALFGISSGRLNWNNLTRIMADKHLESAVFDESDIGKMMRPLPDDVESVKKLHALWNMLVPEESLRKAVVDRKKTDFLAVVGNRPLDRLMFECLVLKPEPQPKKLYGRLIGSFGTPSATQFYNMKDRTIE